MRLLPSSILVTLAVLAVVPAFAATPRSVDITRAGFTPDRMYDRLRRLGDLDEQGQPRPSDSRRWRGVPDLAGAGAEPGLRADLHEVGKLRLPRRVQHEPSGHGDRSAGLSIAARPGTVRYGKAPMLFGNVSSGAAGETVTIEARDCLRPAFTRVGTLTSADRRRLEPRHQADRDHDLPGELAKLEERSADRGRCAGGLVEARPPGPLLLVCRRCAVLHGQVRRPPALRAKEAHLENVQARPAGQGQAWHRPDACQLDRGLPGRAAASYHGCEPSSRGIRPAPVTRPAAARPFGRNAASGSGRPGPAVPHSHRIFTGRTHLLNLQAVS